MFKRIFVLYIIIFVISVVLIELYISSSIRNNFIEQLKRNLSVQIGLMQNYIHFKKEKLDELCKKFKETTNTRVTIIAADGTVIGDSDTDSSTMDNHRHRTEIEQSLIADSGASIRYSDTLKYDFLYVAKKVTRGDDVEGFIRLAVPLKEIDLSIQKIRTNVILIVLSILLATVLFSIWQTDRIRRLLMQLSGFSKVLAQGEIGKRLFFRGASEFDGIARDLNTMSSKLQETIAQNEEEKNRLNVILQSIPDAVLIIDVKGIIRIASLSSYKLFGDSMQAGREFIDVIRNHLFADLMERVRKTLAPQTSEISLNTPHHKDLIVNVSPLFYKEKELSGYVAVFHDISEIKKLDRVRKDFVANVSHELKTPITAIKGFADTLLDGAIDDRENAIKFIKTIQSHSERINSLVDDLMTLSKIELGVIKIEKTLVSVEEVVDAVITMLKGKAIAKNLSLQPFIHQELKEVYADKDRLIQILTNLVDNAIKFTDEGGITFGVNKENGSAFFFVHDTGIGIARQHLMRLGERFYRIDPGRSRKMGGTGLGLAIVKHLVRAHGWEMRIESTLDKGTIVKIYIQS
jgi:two-component system phosphate regulon sensor histidine kinase PhoR